MVLESPVSWNSLIHKLIENRYHDDAIKLYKQMQENRVPPTPRTLTSVLMACAGLKAISEGRQAHAQTIFRGFLPNLILETSLVDFYSKNGEVESGRQMLERMEERNVCSWNSLIRGYSQLGIGDEDALQEEFRSLHAYIIKSGLQTDRFVATSLITMYSEMQHFENSRLAFSDANSLDVGVWSSIISASTKNGEGEVALRIFCEMLDLEIEPNQFIFSSLFTACGNLSAMEMGKQIHAYCLKSRNFSDTATQNSLINMYSTCGWIEEAIKVFDLMKNQNVASFNSIILALAQHGHP
ncbi:Pentatricopeptide repeat-containing protein [Platanthera guangdongensis]|uniref:Pentatricopeptide repeat-containing protein n=1 Tax=Platanthera guangdongensis TaxID=2320717 RepID=A0ABR2LWE0_9ASPA